MPQLNVASPPSKKSKKIKTKQAARKPQRIHRNSKLSKTQMATKRFAEVTIRAIRANFVRSSFTRDDVLNLVSQMRLDSSEPWAAGGYGVNDIATSTRVRKVGDAVQHLLANGELASLDWLRLCLPNMRDKLAAETAPQVLYLPTIRRVIEQHFSAGSMLDAMAVVHLWHSDQHVPESVKRMAVRGAFPVLTRERLLRRGEFNQFTMR